MHCYVQFIYITVMAGILISVKWIEMIRDRKASKDTENGEGGKGK